MGTSVCGGRCLLAMEGRLRSRGSRGWEVRESGALEGEQVLWSFGWAVRDAQVPSLFAEILWTVSSAQVDEFVEEEVMLGAIVGETGSGVLVCITRSYW